MGLTSSKVHKQDPQQDLQEGSIPSTPILTPKTVKRDYLNLDPRSPSTHISRTPLQLSTDALKFDGLEKTEINQLPYETPGKTKSILLNLDPRSPTTEFNRTPIVVTVSDSEIPDVIRNKTLDRVRQSDISTPKSASGKKVLPPKLLESSPIKQRSDTTKRKSFAGLLETNIDFTETDLDVVLREKCRIKEVSEVLSGITLKHTQVTNTVEIINIDPRSPTNEFQRTPIQIIKKIGEIELNESLENKSKCTGTEIVQNRDVVELQDHSILEKCIQEICESVHLNSEIDCQENQLASEAHEENCLNTIPDNEIVEPIGNISVTEIPTEVKSAPITPPVTGGILMSKMVQLEKEAKSAPISPSRTNRIADVNELDKKLTNLIYQDEDIVICPRTIKLKDYDSRSPLRSLNRNEPEKKKSAQKLKIDGKIKKSEYAVSKIPVFKDKSKKIDVQCENTPPKGMEKRKLKVRKSHWDNADATLII